MKQPSSTIHNTFVIERGYPAPPDRVFAAFSDAAQKRRWYVDIGNNEVEHYELDFRPGGKEQARFRFGPGTPVSGLACLNEAWHLDIVPDRRIVSAATMSIAGRPISATMATFEFLPSANGTDLILTHQGAFFEGSDGPVIRETGWRALLDNLAAELAR